MILGDVTGVRGVQPSPAAKSQLRPIDAARMSVHDGFWGERLRTNRERTIPHGFAQLRRAGTLDNLRLAAGAEGTYRAERRLREALCCRSSTRMSTSGSRRSAGSWAARDDPGLRAAADEAIAVVAAAQRPDGYLNSFVEVVRDGRPYTDLAWGHEFYCVGHLVQAAVAWHRALGDDRLLTIAVRAVDHIDREFGAGGRDGIDGHPGIEMALVELARTTGEERYLALAARMLDLRGHGLLGDGRFGPAYWQDHEPIRDAAEVAGHSVRQLYLDCGAVDVAVERGDEDLLAAVQRRWHDMVRTRRYLTGAWAAGTATRRSATRTSCRPTARTRRPARPSRASCWPGACCWRPANPATPTPSSGPSTTACCPACRGRARSSSTSTRCSGGPTAPSSRPATGGACRGRPAPAARPTSCGC